MPKKEHSAAAQSTTRAPHLRLVTSESDPPPPTSQDDYGASPRDIGSGKFPRTKAEKMARRLAEKDLGILHDYHRLHGYRRINTPFRIWLADHDIDTAMIYSAEVYGKKLGFTVEVDVEIRIATGKFLRIHPVGETAEQTRKRRHAFNSKARRNGIHVLEPDTAIAGRKRPVSRLQSLVNALPAAPGKITTKEVAAKLRNHRAWRDRCNGSKMALQSIVTQINTHVNENPGLIGSDMVYRPIPTRLIWRR